MTSKSIIIILSVLLLASLGGNFFQAGLLIGKNAELKALGPVILPEADQKMLAEAMQASKPKMDELRKKMATARGDVQKAMEADPFSKEDLDAALKKVNDRKREFLVYVQQQRAATLKKLSPEAKAMLQRANGGRPQQQQGNQFPPFVWEDINLPN